MSGWRIHRAIRRVAYREERIPKPEERSGSSLSEDSGVTGWQRNAHPKGTGCGTEILVFSFFFLTATFLTWPLLIKFTSSVYGVPVDNVSQIWFMWWFDNAASFGATTSFCPLIGFPFGSPLTYFYTDSILHHLLLPVFNEVVTYNIDLFLSFFLSGITMYYLVRHVCRDKRAAFFGGLSYMMGVYHATGSMYVSGYVSTIQWIPLYLLSLFMYIEKPNLKRAAFVIISAALVISLTPEYSFYMGVFTVSFLLGRLIYRIVSIRDKENGRLKVLISRFNPRTAVLTLIVIVMIFSIMIPVAYSIASRMHGVSNRPKVAKAAIAVRDRRLSDVGGLNLSDYLLPSNKNPLLGKLINREVFGGTDFYLGWVVILMALVGTYATLRHKRNAVNVSPCKDNEVGMEPDEKRFLVFGLVCAALVCFILSIKPYVTFQSFRIPMPSELLSYFVPWLRFYQRFCLVVYISLILLACFGLVAFLKPFKRAWKGVVLGILAILLAMELAIVPPFRSFSFAEIPPVFKRVAELPNNTGVVFYPIPFMAEVPTNIIIFYQRWFKKPMLNGASFDSEGEVLRRTVFDPFDPDTPAILRRFNIKYLVYFGGIGDKSTSAPAFENGVELIEEFRGNKKGWELPRLTHCPSNMNNAWLYRITSPKADIVPFYLGDITEPRKRIKNAIRLLFGKGIIRLNNYCGRDAQASIDIPVVNLGGHNTIRIYQDGRKLFEHKFTKGGPLEIKLDGLVIPRNGTDLSIVASGEKTPLMEHEAMLFGTKDAYLTIGDVSITVR